MEALVVGLAVGSFVCFMLLMSIFVGRRKDSNEYRDIKWLGEAINSNQIVSVKVENKIWFAMLLDDGRYCLRYQEFDAAGNYISGHSGIEYFIKDNYVTFMVKIGGVADYDKWHRI